MPNYESYAPIGSTRRQRKAKRRETFIKNKLAGALERKARRDAKKVKDVA